MRAVMLHGPLDVRVEDRPDPVIVEPTDAIVRVVAACVCGSDLWGYRGVVDTPRPKRIGHEFVGIVEQVAPDVTAVAVGDFVIAPFYHCDFNCVNCHNGVSTSCLHGGWWGSDDRDGHLADGAQGEFVRVPNANGTLVATPTQPTPEQVPGLLTLATSHGRPNGLDRIGGRPKLMRGNVRHRRRLGGRIRRESRRPTQVPRRGVRMTSRRP